MCPKVADGMTNSVNPDQTTRNDPQFSDKQCRPDQTAPDQGLHCLQFRLHLLDTLLYGKYTLFNFRLIAAFFRVSEYVGVLR